MLELKRVLGSVLEFDSREFYKSLFLKYNKICFCCKFRYNSRMFCENLGLRYNKVCFWLQTLLKVIATQEYRV